MCTDYGAFVYELETMEDAARAKAITELDADTEWRDPRHVLGFLEKPTACQQARLALRPLPDHWNPPDAADLRAANEHLSGCADCQDWANHQMPFVFDLGWSVHQTIWHRRVQVALRHPDDWSGSYAAAVRHCERCKLCGSWLEYLSLVRSCKGVRSRAIDVGTRFAYGRTDEPDQLIDEHIASCVDCQQWCVDAVSCAQVRHAAERIGPANSIEW